MQYVLTFLEGMLAFVSPCLLPMLPVYVTYFSAGEQKGGRRTAANAGGFILGFTLVFLAMGCLAGLLGSLLTRWETVVRLVCGGVMVLLGLSFLGLFRLSFGKGIRFGGNLTAMTFPKALFFGIAFSLGWTPCVGAFLGSALMLAAQKGSVLQGILLLLCYAGGLGLPFFGAALFLDRLKGTLALLREHSRQIDLVCGGLLILFGILMMTGLLQG